MLKIAILCGGKGTRIRSLTTSVPKPLIPVAGKPIMEHILEFYKSQGFRDFIVCVGHEADKIENFLKTRRGLRVMISNEGENAGMLHRIFALREQVNENLWVCYGDTFSNISVRQVMASHQRSGKAVTILTAKIKSPFGLVTFDKRGRAVRFQEKPILDYYIGHMVLHKKAFNLMSAQMVHMNDAEGLVRFFQLALQKKQLNTYEHRKINLTFNTPQEHREVDQKLRHFHTHHEERFE